ncbi:MAG: acyl-CoA reductase [Cryomorphaceae bacterium]|nr:MAG: acyl-CoA reductase [Cryomorphaceae bacterium]
MNKDLKERIQAFSDLGILLRENSSKQKIKTFQKWDSELNKLLSDSYQYNSWFTENNLKLSLKNWSAQLNKKNIENWLENYKIELKSSKTVAIIMAGNVPIVGFHDLICSLILGFKCIVKLSSDDKILIPLIVKFIQSRFDGFKENVYFESNILKNFDAVIATGSNNSHKYFEYYFGKYPNLLRKTRHSVAVLNGDESDNELALLSNDVFDYFGLGCRSVSKIFIPKGYDLDLLFNAFYKKRFVIDHNKYVNNYDYNKAVYLMSEEKFYDNGFVILKEEKKLGSPIACVYFEYYEDLVQVQNIIKINNQNIQCVVSNEKIFNGISFGTTQCPKLSDYADNVDTLKFLLKI